MSQSDKKPACADESLTSLTSSYSGVRTWIVCLCADWCSACQAYRAVFSQTAQSVLQTHPGCRFVWIDVEDQADLVGDLEIETFPTLLVGNGEGLNFFGAVTPQPDVLRRLVNSLMQPGATQIAHQPATQRIMVRLADLPGLGLSPEALNR